MWVNGGGAPLWYKNYAGPERANINVVTIKQSHPSQCFSLQQSSCNMNKVCITFWQVYKLGINWKSSYPKNLFETEYTANKKTGFQP